MFLIYYRYLIIQLILLSGYKIMPNRRLKNARRKINEIESLLLKKNDQIQNLNKQINTLTAQHKEKQLKYSAYLTPGKNIELQSKLQILQINHNQLEQKLKKLQTQILEKNDHIHNLQEQIKKFTIQPKKEETTQEDCLQQQKITDIEIKVQKLQIFQKIIELARSYKSAFNSTYSEYHSSNYFHVGPRYELLGFCRKIIDFCSSCNQNKYKDILNRSQGVKIEINEQRLQIFQKIIELARSYKSEFNSTYSKYNSSNYFHVDPRYELLGFCRKIIDICSSCNQNKQNTLLNETQRAKEGLSLFQTKFA